MAIRVCLLKRFHGDKLPANCHPDRSGGTCCSGGAKYEMSSPETLGARS